MHAPTHTHTVQSTHTDERRQMVLTERTTERGGQRWSGRQTERETLISVALMTDTNAVFVNVREIISLKVSDQNE